MTNEQLNLAQERSIKFEHLYAKLERLAPYFKLVSEYAKTWSDRDDLIKIRRGRKQSHAENVAQLNMKMIEEWPLVRIVQKSRQLIYELLDQVKTSEDGTYDLRMAANVDDLWDQIRSLKEIVPKAIKHANSVDGGNIGRKNNAVKFEDQKKLWRSKGEEILKECKLRKPSQRELAKKIAQALDPNISDEQATKKADSRRRWVNDLLNSWEPSPNNPKR